MNLKPVENQNIAFHKLYPFCCTKHKLLWDYLQQLLNDPQQRYNHVIHWQNRFEGIFKILDPAQLSQLWGIKKNHPTMNYDKLSRSLRYYYKENKLRKVQGQRQVYQFLFSDLNPPHMDSNIALFMDELNKNRNVFNFTPNFAPQYSTETVKKELVVIKDEKTDDVNK